MSLHQGLESDLAAAVMLAVSQQPHTYSDECVAVIHMLAVVKEGLYVKTRRRLHFNFRQQGLSHSTRNTAASAAHRCAYACAPGC